MPPMPLLDHVMLLLLKGRAKNPLLIIEDKYQFGKQNMYIDYSRVFSVCTWMMSEYFLG